MIHLLEEAMIDQISDEDIKKNKKAILAFLGTMYASAGNTQLSVVPKNVADKEELVSLGFTPQPGGNYIFLQPGQTKALAQKPDVTRAINAMSKNTSLITSLKRINNKQELVDLLVSITQYINDRLKNSPANIKTDLFSIGNKISLKEEDKISPDTENAIKIIDRYTGLKTYLTNINDREEYKQFINNLLSYVDKSLFNRKADIRGAVMTAANKFNTSIKK